MRSECFLDTNVLIYAAAGKKDDPFKYAIANRLVSETQFGLSTQVLAEFYYNARRKFAVALPLQELHNWIESLAEFPMIDIDFDLVCMAITHSERYSIAYWDAALVAACERLDAPILYTEDLNHRQTYGSVTVLNPFRIK